MSAPTALRPAAPRHTAPVGLALSVMAGLRTSAPALLALIFVMRDEGGLLWMLIAAVLALLAVNVILAWLRWHRFTYQVNVEDIRVESGVLSRSARSVPYERIQDVSLEQGPLARLFGLVKVGFETGAGGKEELSLAYLTAAEGEQLRELVRARRNDAILPVPASADPEAHADDAQPVLFAMSPRRVLTFGLFEFSLAVLAVLLGVTQQFDFLLPFDIWDFEAWQDRLAGPGAWLAGLGLVAQIVGGGLAILSLLTIGFATGVVRTALREWGFTLEQTAKGFRRRRGLLTRTDVVMPAHRVQAMRIDTRFLRRRFGWHGLKFVSLARDAGSGSHVVAPFGQLRELWPVARAAGFEEPAQAVRWHRASPHYRLDRMLVVALPPMAAAVILLALGLEFWALAPLSLALLLAIGEWVAWRRREHATDARQIFARRGWLAPRLDIAPRVKLQSVDFRQGPLARRHGYGTVHLGVAGGTLAIAGVTEQHARRLRHEVLTSVGEADFSSLNRP